MADDDSIQVEVTDACGRVTAVQQEWIRRHAGAAMVRLGVSGRVGVRIVSDAEMDAAHRRHSGVEGTTDVLTFDLRAPGSAGLDTDVLVCVDEAERQARAAGHPVERELLLYVVHGVLHCLGHDDHDEASAARMHAAEDALLIEIGVGATFGSVA
ncbi:MAG: rRNA maturation RNase YbeY [Phycisphaerae bacterium]|nr:rRNA maturation RNase YbeY [Phycisphaerae bacterium]